MADIGDKDIEHDHILWSEHFVFLKTLNNIIINTVKWYLSVLCNCMKIFVEL